MSESAKSAYLRLRSEYAGTDLPADEAHARACRYAHVRGERTRRAYRQLWEQSQPAPFTVRRPEELRALASRYGKPDGLAHLESAYLSGELSLAEIENNIPVTAAIRQRLADEAVQLRHRQSLEKPMGYVDLAAGRAVAPGEPHPIHYEHGFTADDMRGFDTDISDRSRRAATQWNIVNGGTPIDEASAAVMADHLPTPLVAVPFLRPTFDNPHGLTGKESDEWTQQLQRDADEKQQEAWDKRREQLREEDRQRAADRQMDRLRAGSPRLGVGSR